jgi:predicted ATPase
MDEIIIERYEEPKVDLYNNKDEFIGVLNNLYELNYIIIQLLKKELTGYYIMWEDKRIDISKDGNLSSFPRNLYDKIQQQYAEIFRIRKELKNEKRN